MLACALLAPELPGMLVLNEPETSLHPDVLPALADLVAEAVARTQVVLVCHDRGLVEHLRSRVGDRLVHHELCRDHGRTVLAGADLLNAAPWQWGRRRRW